jgi:ABC-type glycerol-3-phosphate transport system permease component
MVKQRVQIFGVHAILIAYSALALGPILLVVMNSFKTRNAIFGAPLAPPTSATFSFIGYMKVFNASHIGTYFMNSLIVTVVSMALVLLFGNGGVGADRIQISRLDRARPVSVDRHHGPDPSRLRRDSHHDA